MSATTQHDILDLPSDSAEFIFRDFARSIISSYIKPLEGDIHHDFSPVPLVCDTSIKSNVVGILGAGVGGLYTALILQSLGIPFEIIEGSDRIGGRLYTHKFEHKKAGKYDYYVSVSF